MTSSLSSEKGKRQNSMTVDHIAEIVKTYSERPEVIELYARRVEMGEIENEIRKAAKKHNGFLRELGLPPLPGSH